MDVVKRARDERKRQHKTSENNEALHEFLKIQKKNKNVIENCKEHVRAMCNPNVLNPDSGWAFFTITSPVYFYKIVASLPGGSLVSVYDGKTNYNIGKWLTSKHGGASWPPLYACFHGCLTAEQALAAKFPPSSKLIGSPKALIECIAVGPAYLNNEKGRWAVSRLKPVKMITQVNASEPLDIHYSINPAA